jgi:hypothetical protein
MVGRTHGIAMNSKLQIIRLYYKINVFNILTIVTTADFSSKWRAYMCVHSEKFVNDPYIYLDCQ